MRTTTKAKSKRFDPGRGLNVDNRISDWEANSLAKTVDAGKVQMEAPASSSALISIDGRHRLIADAAYFRAERRSFVPGFELEDWLGAEAEIDMKLSKY